jgi:hypothetical protein
VGFRKFPSVRSGVTDPGRGHLEPDRSASDPDEAGFRPPRAEFGRFGGPADRWRACAGGGLVARIGPPVGPVLADSPDPGMLP